MSPLGLGRALGGTSYVSAACLLVVPFLSTGSPVFLALALVAGAFAWWLLRDDAPPPPPVACGCPGWCDL